MVGHARSVNGIKIRLTTERWLHVVNHHDELADQSDEVLDTIEQPELIIRGNTGELIAARQQNRHWLVVVYREEHADGFVITAFCTTRIGVIRKRGLLWPKPSKKR